MERFTLLPAQENIEKMMLYYQEEALCNMGGFFRISSEEQVEITKKMLSLMPEAYGVLRLMLPVEGSMRMSELHEMVVPVYESKGENDDEIYERIKAWVLLPFEKDKPLFAACLFRFENGQWYGCEKFHHLIMDKHSLLLLIEWQLKMVQRLQQEEYEKVKKSMIPDLRYLQIMQKGQEGYATKEQAKMWVQNNFTHKHVDWLDHKVTFSSKAESVEGVVEPYLYEKIHDYANKHHVSVESLWFLAFFVERFKRKGITYGVIGRMTEYRKRTQKDVVGLFSRILPISFEVSDVETSSLCTQLDASFFTSLRYGEYSLLQLQQMESEANMDFDILVSYHPERMVIPQNQGYWAIESDCIDTPLRIWINDAKKRSSIQIFYQNTLYQLKEVEELVQRYVLIMEQLVNGVKWEEITLLSEKDCYAYELLNKSEKTIRPQKTISQLFMEWACQQECARRDEVILRDVSEEWTYQQTLGNFFAVIDWLQKEGVKQGDIIGIYMERTVWLPVVMLAVLETGAVFLPIGYGESDERKNRLMQRCRLVVDKEQVNKDIVKSRNAYSWEELQKRAKEKFTKNFATSELKKRCAYLLYTSGSTGEPKAVQISHYALMCRLQWMYDKYGNGEVTLQKTVNTFDVSIWELLLNMAYGGVLCMLPQGEEKYPDSLAFTVDKWKINRIHFVPSMLEVFVYYLKQTGLELSSLKEIFASGEALKPEVAAGVHKLLPKVRLINLYGPTECTIDVSYHECTLGEQVIPIGKAVSNVELYVLSPNKNMLQPTGIQGELCIVGDLVGMGYLNDNTGGYFTWKGRPAYRTGDIVSLSEEGELYYWGRKDRQMKLRGMRIDIDAAEKILMENSDISSVYITIQKNCLVAYYEAEKEIISPEKILLTKLPRYNIPERWFWIQNFPRKSNGKLDVKELVKSSKDREITLETMTQKEQWLAEILKRNFEVLDLLPEDNLLDAGLDSLTAMKVIQEIRSYGYDCSYSLIYRYPSIRLLTQILQKEEIWKKGTEYLRGRKESHLLLCIPYGGGESEVFGTLAEELSALPLDIAVVRMSYFEEKTIEEIASELLPMLCEYEKLSLLGYCVGSGLATELAKRLTENKKNVSHIYMISSLPDSYFYFGKKKLSPWNFMNDEQVERCLYRLNSKKLRKKKSLSHDLRGKIPQFRKDATRFFDYMDVHKKQVEIKLQVPVTMFFGGRDILTFGYKRRYKKWQTFYESKNSVISFPYAGHYLLEECKTEVCEVIRVSLSEQIKETDKMES